MPKIVIDNLGAIGAIKDLPAHRLPPNAFTEGQNVHFEAAGVIPSSPLSQVMDPVTGGYPAGMTEFNWLMPFPPQSNPVWVFSTIGSQKRMGTITQTAGTWDATDITRVSGVYNNVAEQRWQGNVFQGLGIFNQEMDVPQLWTKFDPATRLVDLPNWSTNPEGVNVRVRTLRPYKNFLIAMYITDGANVYPYRVRWSDPTPPGQYPATWAIGDPANLSGEFDLAETTDYLVGGLTLGEIFVIYKERTTWGLQYVGGTEVMRSWKILADSGMLFRDCFAAFPGGHFVVTQDDIIVHNGTAGSSTSILQNKQRLWLAETINYGSYWNCFAFTHSQEKEIWFCFPTIGNTFANMALIWHWDTNTIGFQDIPYTPFGADGAVPLLGASDIWG